MTDLVTYERDEPWLQSDFDPEVQMVPELWGAELSKILSTWKGLPPLNRVLYPMRAELATTHPDYEVGPRIHESPGLDMAAVRDYVFRSYDSFSRLCVIINQDTSVKEAMVPTLQQLIGLWAIHARHWIYVNKYRQAKFTSISLTWLLRDCMYLSGINGAIFADRESTAVEALRKLRIMYENLPPEIKVPLVSSKSRGSEHSLEFEHGGSIQVFWASGSNPGMGRSFDRVVITEWGKVLKAQNAVLSFFPAFSRRPQARVIVESTPGDEGTISHTHWMEALERGRLPSAEIPGYRKFMPIFLEYYRDPSCSAPVHLAETDMTPDEIELLRIVRKPTVVAFVRAEIAKLNNNAKLFEKVFPRSPHAGWRASTRTALPENKILELMQTSKKQTELRFDTDLQLVIIHEPEIGDSYLIVADGAKATEAGDPSAVTIWSKTTWRLMAYWSDRIQPRDFAAQLYDIGKYYSDAKGEFALLVVEKNAGEVLENVKRDEYPNLFYETRRAGGEGWTASHKSQGRAMGRLLSAIAENEMMIEAYTVLMQLLAFDGKSRKTRQLDAEGNKHHQDLAMTVMIAADILFGYSGRETPDTQESIRAKKAALQMTEVAPDVFELAERRQRKMLESNEVPFECFAGHPILDIRRSLRK